MISKSFSDFHNETRWKILFLNTKVNSWSSCFPSDRSTHLTSEAPSSFWVLRMQNQLVFLWYKNRTATVWSSVKQSSLRWTPQNTFQFWLFLLFLYQKQSIWSALQFAQIAFILRKTHLPSMPCDIWTAMAQLMDHALVVRNGFTTEKTTDCQTMLAVVSCFRQRMRSIVDPTIVHHSVRHRHLWGSTSRSSTFGSESGDCSRMLLRMDAVQKELPDGCSLEKWPTLKLIDALALNQMSSQIRTSTGEMNHHRHRHRSFEEQ